MHIFNLIEVDIEVYVIEIFLFLYSSNREKYLLSKFEFQFQYSIFIDVKIHEALTTCLLFHTHAYDEQVFCIFIHLILVTLVVFLIIHGLYEQCQ